MTVGRDVQGLEPGRQIRICLIIGVAMFDSQVQSGVTAWVCAATRREWAAGAVSSAIADLAPAVR